MKTQKQNVSKFNADVAANEGYRYTTNASWSSVAANQRMTDAILATIPRETSTLIDIGCGDGAYTAALKAARPELACARRRFPEVEYIPGELLEPAGTPGRRFDVAVIRGVIHHLPDPAVGIANALRLSDTVILVEPNGDNPVLKWLERNSKCHFEHEEQSFPARQLEAWCGAAGARVRTMDHIGFIPMFCLTPLAKLIHALHPGRGSSGSAPSNAAWAPRS